MSCFRATSRSLGPEFEKHLGEWFVDQTRNYWQVRCSLHRSSLWWSLGEPGTHPTRQQARKDQMGALAKPWKASR